MANFMQDSVVKFACSCGILNPITKLYFCRHCLKLRCGFCVCHEVDSNFCSNCLENIPSSEARRMKNRCTSCFNCPCCQHTLSARATTVVVQRKTDEPSKEGEPEPKAMTKKMYYLSCLACRWTSRDVGIPDQSVATGSWPDNEYAHQTRFDSLLEYYQSVVLQEKQEKQEYNRRKTPKSHKFPTLTDRTGLTVAIIRRQMGWPDKNPQKPKLIQISPSAATDNVEELNPSIFTQKINIKNITTIQQRHGQPADQPFTVNNLYPQRKCLWIKRSLRCRQCEHNVIKPEYHPGSIKYRIQLFANYHVPDVLLVRCEMPLKPGNSTQMILKLTNPTMHDMTITIMDLPTEEEELGMIETMRKNFEQQATVTTGTSSPSLNTSLSRQISLSEEPRCIKSPTNASLEMLDSSFVLNQRDDSTEFDEEVQVQREEPKFITWRKSNKVTIKMNFIPDEALKPGDDVTLGFLMQYTYVNTVTNTPEKKEPQKHALTSKVYIKVGKIEA